MTQFDCSVKDLQTQYDTAGPYYLSNFYEANGEKDLYEFLKSCYQPRYKDNFRILIVQDCADVYDYQDLPGKALCSLQKYASQLDISNFFILVITANKNIAVELEQVQQFYSTDTCCIQHFLIDHVDYIPVYTKSQDTFCVLPWIHLYVGTDGNVLPCCQADRQFPLGNITEQNIDSIMTSSEFVQLRKDLLEGKRRKECRKCYEQEESGFTSSRIVHNARWSQKVRPDKKIIDFVPLYLDIRLNNICNLKCRMCSGYFSSAIAQEEVELFGTSVSVESSLRLKSRKLNLKKILNYLPTVEKIYFAGGEPLLASEHYEILDALIACGNTNLEIVYNTNFTTLTYRDRSVLDLWKNFTNVTVGASLDAIGNVAEYVRHGTVWQNIENNVAMIKSQCPRVKFNVTSTLGLLNVSSLIDLQKIWHENNILDISRFSFNILTHPEHLSVCALPVHHKTRLENVINNHISFCNQNGAEKLAKQWKDVLLYMWSKDTNHNMTEFQKLTNLMDQHRHESLIDVLPEYKDLL